MKKTIEWITTILNLALSIVKSRWILFSLFTFFVSSAILLWDRLFTKTTVELPVIVFIVIGVVFLYAPLKALDWIIRKRKVGTFHYNGLQWRPSRLKFRLPQPICPHCGSKIMCKVERNPIIFVNSENDAKRAGDSIYKHICECPQHGILDVPNEPIEYIQELARKYHENQQVAKQYNAAQVMVDGAIANPAATPEPCVRPFGYRLYRHQYHLPVDFIMAVAV